MKNTILSLLLGLVVGCGDATEEQTEVEVCTYRQIGSCEYLGNGTFSWSGLSPDIIFSDYEKSLMRPLNIVECRECIGQDDVWGCVKHDIKLSCEEIR